MFRKYGVGKLRSDCQNQLLLFGMFSVWCGHGFELIQPSKVLYIQYSKSKLTLSRRKTIKILLKRGSFKWQLNFEYV